MPDEFEVPETPESPEGRKERAVGLIVACIAVALAIVTHLGNETNNEKMLNHIDASDQYAFYQTKKLRIVQLGALDDVVVVFRNLLPADKQVVADDLITKNEAEIKHLETEGEKIKAAADDLVQDARKLHHKSQCMEIGEIALQIAVVLCSITILTEQRLFVRMGVSVAVAGALVAAWGIFFMH